MRALDGVDFTVRPGEVQVLVGENGAGKSTLVKILAGCTPTTKARSLMEGRPLHLRSPRDAQHHGIAIIHQDLQQVRELTVYENLFLGREYQGDSAGSTAGACAPRPCRWLGDLGLTIDVDRPIKRLRVAERQLLEIAKALSLRARILIMDEPTSALNPARSDPALPGHPPAARERRRDHLYQPPARRDLPDRRSHHRAAGRPARRLAAGCRARPGGRDPAHGRARVDGAISHGAARARRPERCGWTT